METMKYFGIDIGGTAVKYGIVTDQGEIVCSGEYPVAFDHYETPILETVVATSQDFLQKQGIDTEKLSGIGVSATGQIDSGKRIVAGVGGNIRNWKDATIGEVLEALYNLPVTVVNDANCVALGEKWIGAGKDYSDFLVITVGTGIGGGIMVNNQVLLGSRGFAGELGHFSIDRNGRPCTCGNRGCYEQYASMTALVRTVREQMPIEGAMELSPEEINGKVIFQLVEAQNEQITKIVEEWIRDIATGLVSLTHIFNPQCILIGGGVSMQEELFVAKVRQQVKARVMEQFGCDLQVERAALGNHAGLVGAVYYLITSR